MYSSRIVKLSPVVVSTREADMPYRTVWCRSLLCPEASGNVFRYAASTATATVIAIDCRLVVFGAHPGCDIFGVTAW